MEVITGPERRRDWPDDRKIAIVAKALVPGVNVSGIARAHDLNPQQLFGWRKKFHAEAMDLIAGDRPSVAHNFAPVVIETTTNAVAPVPPVSSTEPSSIEISIGTATVRIRGAADAKTLALVLKALKVLA
ncbi:MAG: transposase [Sphingomonadales bacterium]|nr:transposase [Sphingomonadales bacterium]